MMKTTALGLTAGLVMALAAGRVKDAPVTFNRDVAPILAKNCQGCHRPGEAAPMSLLTYAEARPWAKAIREAVILRRMPPWYADSHFGKFSNDRSLSQADIDTLAAWAGSGAVEGDPKHAPAPARFIDGWTIGTPDLVLEMTQDYQVPAAGTIKYEYFTIPTRFTEDKWVRMAEVRPGNRAVVHHVIAFVKEPKKVGETRSREDREFLVGFAPGSVPEILPPERVITLSAGNNKFVIPAGDPNHEVESRFTLRSDATLTTLFPHMHLRGKDFEYRVVLPDGRKKTLLKVPNYSFSWQLSYDLAEPMLLPKGSVIECTAHFDNSPNNKYNPDATKEVRHGDQSWEEMMIGFFNVAFDAKADPKALFGGKKEAGD